MVGTLLSAHGGLVIICTSMQIMVPITTVQQLHAKYLEVVSISAYDMNSLAKTQLNLEAVSLHLNDFQVRQRGIGTQQKAGSTHRMVNNAKSHDVPNRPPEQIQHPKPYHHIAPTIFRTGRTRVRQFSHHSHSKPQFNQRFKLIKARFYNGALQVQLIATHQHKRVKQ